MINTLRYHQRWVPSSGDSTQELDAGYSLRAATTLLGSNLAYTRHVAHLKYNYSSRTQSVEVTMIAGAIYGQAPLFERFALGDSTLLRGWNKYDLDPLGGNRLAYGSVTYGYHIMRVFYDTGSVWDQGKSPEAKESAGIGVSSGLGVLEKGAFLAGAGFSSPAGPRHSGSDRGNEFLTPLRNSGTEPRRKRKRSRMRKRCSPVPLWNLPR